MQRSYQNQQKYPASENHNTKEQNRITVYYDGRPSNATEREKPICMVLKSSGQVIRFNEKEAFDLLMDMTKALRWNYNRSRRYQ